MPCLMGKVYFSKGLSNMAIYEYQKGLELQPSNYLLYIYMAKAYSKQQKVDLAIDSFRKAIELMPPARGGEYNAIMGKAYVDLGKAYLEKGELTLAREVLESAYRLTPQNARISHYLGLIYMGNKDYRKALNLEPNNAEIMADLGNLFAARGDTELAIKAYRRALEIAPDKITVYEMLIQMLAKAGRTQEAVDTIRQARERDRSHSDHYHWLMGTVFMKSRDFQRAAEEFLKAITVNEKKWNYYYDLAGAYKSLNYFEDATRNLQYAAALCKERPMLEQIDAELKRMRNR